MKNAIFIILLCWLNTSVAQSRYEVFLLPSVNLNTSLSKKWKINFRTESRQRIEQGVFSESSDKSYEYVLTDFSLITSRKVGLNNSLAGGYLLRLREGEIIHRAIQQFTVVRKYERWRLAHRFSADQTFAQDEAAEVRLRYRISSEIPLNGDVVNKNEIYLKINNEYLNEFQDADYDLEIRLVPLLGYVFSDNNKVELGLDYRLDSFIADTSRHRFFMSLNWFVAF